MVKIPPDSSDGVRLIPSEELGQPYRGLWASAAFQNKEYGLLVGVTQGTQHSFALFIPESRFAEFRKRLPKHWRETFESAARRLSQFKASHIGGFSNPGRA
jgi:hypothetical protein